MKSFRLAALLAAICFAAVSGLAVAQSSGSVQAQTPLTRDIGAIQSLAASVPGTYNSSDQNGFNVSRVVCVLKQTGNTGGTTATVSIQNKDTATGGYYTLITSGSINTNGQFSPVSAGAGITTVSNVSSSTHMIARTWRTQVVLTGGTNWTGTVSCNLQ